MLITLYFSIVRVLIKTIGRNLQNERATATVSIALSVCKYTTLLYHGITFLLFFKLMYQIERQNRCILQTLSTLQQSNNTRKTEEEILDLSLRSHHNLKQMKYFCKCSQTILRQVPNFAAKFLFHASLFTTYT